MTKPKKLRKAKRPSYIEPNRFILFTLKPTEGKIFLFSLIALAGGIVSLILRFNTASWILIFLGFIGIIAGLIRLCRNLFSMPKSLLEKDSKILDKISSILPSIHEEKFAYKTFEVPYRREQVVRSSEVDRLLQSTKIRLLENSGALLKILSELQASANQMEQILRCQFRKCLRSDPPKQFTNESKLCMASDIFSDLTEIKIYRGSYFISFLTNEICTRKLVTLTEFPTTIFSGSEMFPLTHDSDGNIRLKPISQSLMGNHIGISTIGHSVDGKLCLWRQSKKALQSVDLLAPTGSGSCDWTDIPSSNLLEDLELIRK